MLKWIYILFLSFISLAGKADIILSKPAGKIPIGKQLEILQPGKEISFAEALKSTHFIHSTADVPNLGLSTNSIWFRFTITNQTENEKFLLEIAYPLLDEVDFFVPGNDNHYRQVTTG